MDKQVTVTDRETLIALRKTEELYVIVSMATRMPFVRCDEETFDDEVLLYYRLSDAQDRSKALNQENYLTTIVKVEEEQRLGFYTNLYVMGVNSLAVNYGTDMQTHVQLESLVTRRKPNQIPENQQIIENPALHLTTLYFTQELRHMSTPQPTDHLVELQEEMIAHFQSSTLLVAVREDGQTPLLKLEDGTVFQPVFTDIIEFQKFDQQQGLKAAIVPSVKVAEMLVPEAKGVVINPFGVNMQLQIERAQNAPKETQ